MAINIKLTNHVNWKKNKMPDGLFVFDVKQMTPRSWEAIDSDEMYLKLLQWYKKVKSTSALPEDATSFPTDPYYWKNGSEFYTAHEDVTVEMYKDGKVIDTFYSYPQVRNINNLGVVVTFGVERNGSSNEICTIKFTPNETTQAFDNCGAYIPNKISWPYEGYKGVYTDIKEYDYIVIKD